MKDPELEILIETLERHGEMSVADLDGVVRALHTVLPQEALTHATVAKLGTTDGAMHVADDAYPDWAVHIHGRANDRDGHWRCSLRESDNRDNDAVIGAGRSPVLSQAILAAVLRLSMRLKQDA